MLEPLADAFVQNFCASIRDSTLNIAKGEGEDKEGEGGEGEAALTRQLQFQFQYEMADGMRHACSGVGALTLQKEVASVVWAWQT